MTAMATAGSGSRDRLDPAHGDMKIFSAPERRCPCGSTATPVGDVLRLALWQLLLATMPVLPAPPPNFRAQIGTSGNFGSPMIDRTLGECSRGL